jgi:U3 small nucleolar RNA-associated protein 3
LGLSWKRAGDDDEEAEEFEEEEEAWGAPKERKVKAKADLSTKGRFGKEEVSSDEYSSDEGSGSGSDEDEEGWGRQYYSRPSTRREREKEDEYDEKREEERDMEEREVRRLQRRARESLAEDDWGLDDVAVEYTLPEKAEAVAVAVSAPVTDDPEVLVRHLQAHEPLKLALARDFPLVLRKLRSTAKGIKRMSKEREGEESLHKGLGWLHYRELIPSATLTCRGAVDVCDYARILHPPVRAARGRAARHVGPPDPPAPPAAQGGRGDARGPRLLGGLRVRRRARAVRARRHGARGRGRGRGRGRV